MEQQKLSDGITLLSGALFSYENPELADVTIEDIANPLSNICRYAGQLPYFYSVAQHAVNASYLVSPENAFTALMHDTAEAFTNDIVTPLKVAVPLFKTLEKRIEAAMAEKFGFQYPLPDEVHLADKIMLGLEMTHIRGQDPRRHAYLNGVEYDFDKVPRKVKLYSWNPRRSYDEFMDRYEELKPQ
jgi:hypothetical protein